MIVRRMVLLFVLSLVALETHSCFLLFYTDGEHMLVANHEDWFAKDAAMKVTPRSPWRFASITFTFASEGFPQGGMNEKGLFFDAAQTPHQLLNNHESRALPNGSIWQYVLDHAANVSEAISILNRYYLKDLEDAAIMLADASGRAVIVGVHKNELDIREISGRYLMQTNFNQWHPDLNKEPKCERFIAAETILQTNPEASFETLKNILKKTNQGELTIYSNIYDLKSKKIYTYSERNFDDPIITDINEYASHGSCMLELSQLRMDSTALTACVVRKDHAIAVNGMIKDKLSGTPIPFANIGIIGKNLGTLSDPDGTFELKVPSWAAGDTITFTSLNYSPENYVIRGDSNEIVSVLLEEKPTMLDELLVSGKKMNLKVERLGWMGGRDGILPLDSMQGGGAVALLVASPRAPSFVEKLQVRLMYNSNEKARFRFHIYAYDSATDRPGVELLQREIMLNVEKRFGWVYFDLESFDITIPTKKFFIAFEWIDDLETRKKMLHGLQAFEKWKRDEFALHNSKIHALKDESGLILGYKYKGNMMDWPGFKQLPPFTGLMIETGKTTETRTLRTFERKASLGEWQEVESTLNAVVTVRY